MGGRALTSDAGALPGVQKAINGAGPEAEYLAPLNAGRSVGDGRIAPEGAVAVNANGGGLSCVHPGIYGMFLIIEAVTQSRGAAGERQLPRREIAPWHGNGGTLASQVTALLGSPATV